MGRYKFGKKEEIIPLKVVKQRVVNANLRLRDEAFFWLLYYCGARKSEAYERVAGDFKITDAHLIVGFHQRKKRGAEVPPLMLPLNWYGIDKIIQSVRIALSCRPKLKAVRARAADNYPDIADADAETVILMHELGHSIGIVKLNRKHGEWEEKYDPDHTSVMYLLSTENCRANPIHYSEEYWEYKNLKDYKL